MKTKWTKQPPKADGWYWVKYGKHIRCPATFIRFEGEDNWSCVTAVSLEHLTNLSKDRDMLVFGPKIEVPK